MTQHNEHFENFEQLAQQTAVKWFIDEIESKGEAWENASIRKIQISIDVSDYLELKRQAKEMFERQIIKAVDVGFDEGCKFPEDIKLGSGDQYYKETYGK